MSGIGAKEQKAREYAVEQDSFLYELRTYAAIIRCRDSQNGYSNVRTGQSGTNIPKSRIWHACESMPADMHTEGGGATSLSHTSSQNYRGRVRRVGVDTPVL